MGIRKAFSMTTTIKRHRAERAALLAVLQSRADMSGVQKMALRRLNTRDLRLALSTVTSPFALRAQGIIIQ